MDNANKIIDSKTTHKEVVLFLGDDLKKNNNENFGKYDLVEEYAKTARNKQPFVWILLALCFIFVGAGTFTTVMLVANSNHKIAINIDSFDDLNLRSLLNSAGRVKSLYEKAIKDKKNLEENRDDELAQAEQKKANDLFTLKSVSSVTSKESLKSGQKKIEEAFQLTVQKINEDYNEKIAKAEEEISHYKDQVDSYDKNKLSKAEGEEAVLDSTKQLHDLEMRSQAESYEAKIKQLRQQLVDQQIKAAEEQKKAVDQVRQTYQAKINLLDPKAREQSSEQNSIILDTGIKNKASSSKVWKNVEELLFREEDYLNSSSSKGFSEAVKESGRELKELRTLARRFKQIPMENSIKDYVPAMMYQSYEIADNLAKAGKELESQLNEYEDFFEGLLNDRAADAVILRKEPAGNYVAYVASFSRKKVGDNPVAVQFLADGLVVADGTIVKQGETFVVTQIIPEVEDVDNPPEIYEPVLGNKIKIVTE